MPETENRFLHVTLPGEDEPVIRLDADPTSGSVGNVIAGGHSVDGSLLLFRQGATDTTNVSESAVSLRADTLQLRFRRPEDGLPVSMEIEGGLGFIRAGGAPNTNAEIRLLGPVAEGDDVNSPTDVRIHLQTDSPSQTAAVTVGNVDRPGVIVLRDEAGEGVVVIDSRTREITLGGGAVVLGVATLFTPTAFLTLGGSGVPGRLSVSDPTSDNGVDVVSSNARATFRRGGQVSMRLDGDSGNIRCGGSQDTDGDILVFPQDADIETTSQATIHLDGGGAGVRVGTNGRAGSIRVRNAEGEDTVVIDGEAGDIILRNADCAERFDIDPAEDVEPGSVLVLGAHGLRPCTTPYDRTVAGVVSGAGGLRPGIVLNGQAEAGNHAAVALVGRAYCNVTAEGGAIDVGDLLTTSSSRGFAMKATDPERAFGAIVGKALQRLDSGRGRIPLLVALQ